MAVCCQRGLLSLAYLTRPEASITFGLFLAYAILVRLVQRRLFTRRTALRLAGLCWPLPWSPRPTLPGSMPPAAT